MSGPKHDGTFSESHRAISPRNASAFSSLSSFVRILRAISILAIGSLSVFAQPVFEEKVNVTWIEVPVTVTGRDQAPVRGLTQANFEVIEDGRKRAIESFDAIDFAAVPTGALSPLHPAARRKFLLLFDLSFSTPSSVGRAQQAAGDFIARTIGSRDLVAIATVDAERGFRLLTAFTTDRELLVAAIADPVNFRSFDPLQIGSGSSITEAIGGGTVNEGRNLFDDNLSDFKRDAERLDDIYNRARVERHVGLLATAARSLEQVAGRKHLVLLSEGFDPRLVQGRSASESGEQQEENRAIVSGELWKVDGDRRFGNSAVQRSIRLMAADFRRSDVVLHAIDVRGVRVQNDVRAGARVSSNEGLFLLSNSTGGTVFRNSNDVTADFDRLVRQHEVVYILGFHAPIGKPGEFHELRVRLLNVPGGRVQHRGGYTTAGDDSGVERTLTTAEIVINDIPQDEIDLAALAVAFPGVGEKATVPVVLELGGAGLLQHARNGRATVEVFVYAFDEAGLVRDSLYERMQLDTRLLEDRLRGSGVRFYGTLALPPANYAVKTLVRVAESDRKGYRRLDLLVPAAGDVALTQPLFIDEPGDWVMVKATRDGVATPYPFLAEGETFIPDARPTLERGEPRDFAVFVYNADADELVWDVSPRATLVSETVEDEVIKRLFRLERLPAGTRNLAVTIRKSGSIDTRQVSVPITIR
jgi:VWFA-related protein